MGIDHPDVDGSDRLAQTHRQEALVPAVHAVALVERRTAMTYRCEDVRAIVRELRRFNSGAKRQHLRRSGTSSQHDVRHRLALRHVDRCAERRDQPDAVRSARLGQTERQAARRVGIFDREEVAEVALGVAHACLDTAFRLRRHGEITDRGEVHERRRDVEKAAVFTGLQEDSNRGKLERRVSPDVRDSPHGRKVRPQFLVRAVALRVDALTAAERQTLEEPNVSG